MKYRAWLLGNPELLKRLVLAGSMSRRYII